MISCLLFIIAKDPKSYISKTEIGHLISFFFDLNRINVKVQDGIDKNRLKIKWNEEVIYDSNRFLNIPKHIRYFYGSNYFKIYYDDKEISTYCQQKLNNWHYYQYNFKLWLDRDEVNCEVYTEGPDSFECI